MRVRYILYSPITVIVWVVCMAFLVVTFVIVCTKRAIL